MNPFPLAYRWLSSLAVALGLPAFTLGAAISGRHFRGLGQRLGRYPRELIPQGRPRIWLHAASVGEVGVAAAVVDAFMQLVPTAGIILSTTTAQGNDHARRQIGRQTAVVFAPLDAWFPVRSALAAFAPDALVCVETEIWPNWFWAAARSGVATAFVNGRVSARSFSRYAAIRPLIGPVLAQVDLCSMTGEADARRITALGALPARVRVNGNAKFDMLAGRVDQRVSEVMKSRYRVSRGQPVVVAGSIRAGEDRIVLECYSRIRARFGDCLLVVAPRHIHRASGIAARARQMGFSCQMGSELDHRPRVAQIVVVDAMGALFDLYSIATVVFCGASLVPLGGQNVLEPAAWAKPVVFGPFMDDFAEAAEILVGCRGAVQVADAGDLARCLMQLLARPQEAQAMGLKARAAVFSRQGAARRHAEALRQLVMGAAG